jgi:hypothetical protein
VQRRRHLAVLKAYACEFAKGRDPGCKETRSCQTRTQACAQTDQAESPIQDAPTTAPGLVVSNGLARGAVNRDRVANTNAVLGRYIQQNAHHARYTGEGIVAYFVQAARSNAEVGCLLLREGVWTPG